MASGGSNADMDDEFPSLVFLGDGIKSLAEDPQFTERTQPDTLPSRVSILDIDEKFDSIALFDTMEFLTKNPQSRMYIDVDPDKGQPGKPVEEENPYMSLRNCVLDMFKAEMADMLKTCNIHEIETKVRTNRDHSKLKKTSMLMSSLYRRERAGDKDESMDDENPVNVLVVRNLNTNKVAFLKASKKYQDDLSEQLKANKAKVDWEEVEEDRVKVIEIKSEPRPSSQEDVQLWRDEADAAVYDFFKTIMVRGVTMMKNVWTKMKDSNGLSKFDELDKDLVLFIPSDELPGVYIVGDVLTVANAAEDVLEIVRIAEEENLKQSSTHRSSLYEMETWKLQYLLAIDISAKLSVKYQDLKVEVNRDKESVHIYGQGFDITKAKFDIHQMLNRVERRIVENVDRHILQAYTMDEFHEYIQGVLRSKHIEATFQVLSDELWVFAVQSMLEEATRIIKESVKMRYIKTDGLSLDVWEQVLLSINQTTKNPFYIDDMGEEHKAVLICVTSSEDFVMKKLREATRESALQTQRVRLEKGIFLVLKRRCTAEIEDIKSNHKVNVSFDHASCMVAIRGRAGHVTAAVEELKHLSDRIVQQNLDLTSTGASKFCQSLKGDSSMKKAEEEFQCIMEVQVDGVSSDQTFKAQLNVNKGDVCQQLVDVIVNPVANALDLGTSQSRHSVLSEAGTSIEKHLHKYFSGGLQKGEVAVTSGGNLRCKSIFHCSVPQWSSDNSNIEDYQELIKQCLEKADVSNYSSIAFPALGCEQGGFPPLTAATALLDAILSYEETTNSGIKQINIVVDAKDGETYDIFNNERNNRIIGTKNSKEYDDIDDLMTMAAGIRIVVQVGELAYTKADALLNTTNQALDLSYGAVSGSLLKAAGMGLQKECTRTYPKGIPADQLAISVGGKLACKNIYHCHLPKWMGNPGAQESLERIIDKCLELASSAGFETLAVPALGTGIMKYPADVVAALLKDRVALFSQENPLSCLREIIIVLYHKDALTCKAFNEVFERDPELKEEVNSPEEQKNEEFKVGPVQVDVKRGALLGEDVDAIVVPTDDKISLTDAYGRMLIRKCGQSLMQEAQRANIKKSGAVLVSAKPLPCKRILFVSTEFFKNNMDEIVQKIFRKASKNRIHTISVPHINAAIDTKGEMFVKALLTPFTQQKSILKGLTKINLVMTSQPPMTACISAFRLNFGNHLKRRSYRIGESKTDARKRLSVYRTKSEEMPVSDRPHLRMLGRDEESLRRCGEKMMSVISENIADETLVHQSLKSLKSNEIEEIESVCSELDVDLRLDSNGGQIQLQGIKTDVYEAHRSILEIIKKSEFVEVQKEKALDIQTKIQWYYIPPSKTKCPFPSVSNMCVEKAFTEGQQSIPLHLPGETVVLDFSNMTLSVSQSQTFKLIREENLCETGKQGYEC